MQTNLRRGKPAFRMPSMGLSVTILAGSSLVALCAPERALAACRTIGPAGVHAAAVGTGVRAATTRLPTSASGGGGTLGCAGGSSAAAPHGLAVATSGRVLEGGVHSAARPATHAKAAPTRTTNASAHLHAGRPAHHA